MPDPAAGDPDRENWAGTVERWRHDVHPGRHEAVVVAPFAALEEAPLAATTPEQWRRRLEMPFSVGFAALQLAAATCADGGAIVLVVDLPSALDASGHATTVAAAEGLMAAARALAHSEGGRGVRVNAVTTSVRTSATLSRPLKGTPPALTTFPGAIDREVAGAVRALLAPDAGGVTGQVLHADCGRTP